MSTTPLPSAWPSRPDPLRPARALAAALAVALAAAAAHAGVPAAPPPVADPAALCEAAAGRAAAAAGVPADLLLAVALAETGRRRGGRLRPWPWTVNAAGEGHWFATRTEAEAFVEALAAAGATNYDIGCFQLNHRWHGAAFASAAAMFDPEGGARHAAGLLARLAARLGSWEAAAGAYHSLTPWRAAAYGARVAALRTAGAPAAAAAAPAAAAPAAGRPRPRPPATPPRAARAPASAGTLFAAAAADRPLVAASAAGRPLLAAPPRALVGLGG